MEIIPDKRKLIGLVDEANHGRLCLPRFQRDFVWARDEIADLIRSVLRGYFIGSVLLLRSDPARPPFAPVALRGAAASNLLPNHLVLDGQQRLTSLLYALRAPELGVKNSKYPRRYYINLDVLMDDPDSDDIVFDRTEREAKRDDLDTPEGQWAQHVLPCVTLLDPNDFLAWRDGMDDWLHATDGDRDSFRTKWRGPWTEAVSRFQSFEVPVVELPTVAEGDDDAIGRVCAIFEKLNSTGVELSVYDLLTARLFSSRIDLHSLWEEAVEEHPLLADWSGGSADTNRFGVLVLRTLALMRGLEAKAKTLINLKPDQFPEDWRRAAEAMERALELVTHVGEGGFGVFDKKRLPGYGLLPVLAALRAIIEDRGLDEQPRSDLRRWYWSSVFIERYSSGVETKSRRDYQDFRQRWEGGDARPVVFSEAQNRLGNPRYSVRDSATGASSVYSGVFALLAINGARDWAAGEAIELQQLEDHHLFPRAYLTKRGFDATKDKNTINSILNRTLISDATNRRISASAPADYLADPSVFASDPVPLLAAHFVEAGAMTAMLQATKELGVPETRHVYEQFLAERDAAIVETIRQACGVEMMEDTGEGEELDDE